MATYPIPQAPWGEFVPFVGYMTVEQFEMFPGQEGWYYELQQGRLIVVPGPGNKHGKIQTKLSYILTQYLDNHQLGSIVGTSCYNLPMPGDTETVLCPDLSYVLPEREAIVQMRGSYPNIAPDLVIEISSPSDTHPGVAQKVADYLAAEVRLIWVLWPTSQTIEVWRPTNKNQPISILKNTDILDGLDVIPGFQCRIQDIFAIS